MSRDHPRPTLESKVAFLSDPTTYPDGTRRIKAIETHFAWVFLTDSSAFKLKKPVRHGRMDYRTLAGRRGGCLAELRLNRRLAPAVYEAVVPLSSDTAGRLMIGRGERIEDYLVKMRRLRSREMLDRVLEARSAAHTWLERLVPLLAQFYRDAPSNPFRSDRYLARMRRQLLADRRSLEGLQDPLCQALLGRAMAAQLKYIASERGELASRGACVVEAHGDLRAEHVYTGKPCCIIDCLEFNRDLRLLDPIAEIAQLALEVARLGRARTASALLDRFRRCGVDFPSQAVLHFYMSQGAITRAKLAANHVRDPQYPNPRPWIFRTRRHLREALKAARAALRRIDSAGRRRRTKQQLAHRRSLQHSPDRRPE